MFGVTGHSKSSAIDATHTSCRLIRLLLKLCVCLVYRFRDTASYLSKVANFSYLTCTWRRRWCWSQRNFTKLFGVSKLESLSYHAVLFADSTFSHCGRTRICDWYTDRQTRDHSIGIYRTYRIASSRRAVKIYVDASEAINV